MDTNGLFNIGNGMVEINKDGTKFCSAGGGGEEGGSSGAEGSVLPLGCRNRPMSLSPRPQQTDKLQVKLITIIIKIKTCCWASLQEANIHSTPHPHLHIYSGQDNSVQQPRICPQPPVERGTVRDLQSSAEKGKYPRVLLVRVGAELREQRCRPLPRAELLRWL